MQNQREEALEPPGLACNGLTLGYDGRPVIEGLDLSLPPRASLAIVGESGCGKSTLLTALAGLRPSISGTVRWTSPQGGVRSIQDMRTSFVWQHLGLFPWRRVRRTSRFHWSSAGRCADSAGRVSAMLSELRLSGLESRFPSSFREDSGSVLRSAARSSCSLRFSSWTSPSRLLTRFCVRACRIS